MSISSTFLEWLISASLHAAVLVLLILIIKVLLGRLLTPWWHFALWILVLGRLVIPIGPESVFSLSNYVSPSGWVSQGQAQPGPKILQGYLDVRPAVTPPAFNGSESAVADRHAIAALDASGFPFSAMAILLVVWAIGFLTVLLLLTRNAFRLLATIRRADLIDDPEVESLFRSCCRNVGIRRQVQFRQSRDISTPALAGLFRPVVLLPVGTLESTSAAELRFIILHELIHLRRGDLVVGFAAALLQAVHWFNPLIWIGFYRMRADREIACDAEVVRLLGRENAAEYGRTILKLAEQASVSRLFAGSVGIIEVKSETGRRIIMISQHHKQSKAKAICGFAIGAIIVAVGFTEAQSQPAEPEPAVEAMKQNTQEPAAGASVDQPNKYSGAYSSSFAKSIGTTLEFANPSSMAKIADTTGGLSGKSPFTLKVAENDGVLIYTFNETTKGLETISAKTGVVYSTRGTTISCAELTYTSSTERLTAKGPGLEAHLPHGTSTAVVTADSLIYTLDDGIMEFEGDVRIMVKNPDGSVSETVGENVRISIINGKVKFKLDPDQSMTLRLDNPNRIRSRHEIQAEGIEVLREHLSR